MFLSNSKIFKNDFLSLQTLVITADSEYGYHIYAKHIYKNLEVSYYTNSEDLIDIINELNDILKDKDKNKK